MSSGQHALSASAVIVTWPSDRPSLQEEARTLANKVDCECRDSEGIEKTEAALLLVVHGDRLELREPASRGRGLTVDFTGTVKGTRRRAGVSSKQPIARAMGPRRGASIIDATAGLARDTFLLASLGYPVIAVERSPILAAMIHDGLARGMGVGNARVRATLERIRFVEGDAREAIGVLTKQGTADVVYLDPMYPSKKKSALAKKEIRLLRQLVGDDGDAEELFRVAREAAVRRVVVKRHPQAPPLVPSPDVQFKGRTARFDVYLGRG